MKKPKGKLTSLKLTALAGVDRPCQAPALAVIMKRAAQGVAKTMVVVAKQAAMTSETEGHAHVLDLDDPSDSWCDTYSTSYQNMEGSTTGGHSHPWTFDPVTGVVTIGADSGHTHTISDAVPASVLAAYAAREVLRARERTAAAAAMNAAPLEVADAPSDGIPAPIPVEETSAKVRVTVIEARALDGNSTPITKTSKVAPVTTETKPMKLAKFAAILLAMSVAEQSAIAKMAQSAPDELEPFFDKPANEQTAILKAATDADTVVFKGEVSGIEVRKSDGAMALKLAQQHEVTATTLAKREAEIAKAEVRKLAVDVLGGMPGDDDTHDFIIASLRKGGDEVKTQRAIETLKGMRAETKIGKRAPGIGGTDAPIAVTKRAAYVELEKGLLAFCGEKSIPVEKTWVEGLDAFVKTPAGAALYKAHDEAKAA